MPGEAIVYMTYGAPNPITTDEEREWYRLSMDVVCNVLCNQDFPMAQACQRGLEAGVTEVVFGRNEPALHHLAAARAQALGDGAKVAGVS
ncbi:hypothetical protein MPRM_13380 [Mycobacterium parmense]|uniref:Aromatic-ring-hydroxylating dioxygenase alpha subunit C-terminal domain-containing protein n=2 Tax=Mycobacterium parmense TaxID=185642 RepID=A0A7I7YS30_9MYCO|nr:hypothetical protein AWC20_22810 [Mycobacterium parmense]BBZ44057.1 hypothetical protein MPRM_13380 [Mycobacterium parmense]